MNTNRKLWIGLIALALVMLGAIAACQPMCPPCPECEETEPLTAMRERISILFGGTDGTDHVIGRNGADIYMYSDDQSSQVLNLDGAAGSIDSEGDLDVNGTSNLDDVDIDLSASMNIDGHLVDIGTGSYDTADGDNDLGVAGDLEVDGELELDGALDADSTGDFADTVTFSKGSGNAVVVSAGGAIDANGSVTVAGDLTVENDSTGGNAGAASQIIGLPRQALVDLGAGTNPGSETVDCMDSTPTGEWTEVDAGTNLAVSADTSYYRYDTNSVLVAFTSVVENDGVSVALPAQDDLSGLESIGFWIYSDEALTSGDLDLTVDDSDGTDQVYSIGAVSADVWTWVEVDISACDANCDTADNFIILITAQGAGNLTDPNIYIDELFYWDSADEEALGQAIVDKGVIFVLGNETAGGGMDVLVEWTDFIVHYESGSDFIVWVTDQSTRDAVAYIAY